MIALYIRYFFTIICSLYAYCSILNIKIQNKFQRGMITLFTILMPFIISPFSVFQAPFRMTFIIIACILFSTHLFRVNIKHSVITIFISYSLSLLFLIAASVISCLLFLFLYKSNSNVHDIPFLSLIGTLQLLFAFHLSWKITVL